MASTTTSGDDRSTAWANSACQGAQSGYVACSITTRVVPGPPAGHPKAMCVSTCTV
jgi:hypothetical protein